MADPSALDTRPGQAVYNRLTLNAYDLFVLGFTNRLLWRCPTSVLTHHYRRYASDNHLDVGVGSGYLPAKAAHFAGDRLALMDLNDTALAHARRRLAHLEPETYHADLLEPIAPDIAPFHSISLFYVLHCLPGRLEDKARAFDHLDALLEPGGVIFGATVLGDGRPSRGARALMGLYNRAGIFSNANDHLHDLKQILEARYDESRVERRGCVGLFFARKT